MKIRILEVLASLQRAGAEQMAVTLARGLDRRRFAVQVVSLYDAFPQGLESVLQEAGIPVSHLGKRKGLDLRMIPRLAQTMRLFRPAIVHTHSYVLRYVLPAALAGGRPRIVHTVHNLAPKEVDGIGRWIHRVAFQAGTAAVAVSMEVARSFRATYGMAPAATILNGIDFPRFGRDAKQWRRANGFREEDGLIASVARLEPQKNPLQLIEAFAEGLGHEERWHLLLAGGGSLREAAERRAAELGLNRIHFLGVRDDIPEMLSACDLFASAAAWEGCPMAVLEAIAAGLPVVATAVGGVPELVSDGVTGLLVAPDDTKALAESLARLARDLPLRRAYAAQARIQAERFAAHTMIESYAQLFERLAENAG